MGRDSASALADPVLALLLSVLSGVNVSSGLSHLTPRQFNVLVRRDSEQARRCLRVSAARARININARQVTLIIISFIGCDVRIEPTLSENFVN